METSRKIAPYTGVEHVPVYKQEMGYTYQKDKFTMAGFTPLDSQSVKPQRIKECPLQIEANVKQIRIPEYDPFFAIVETEVVHVHAHEEIIKGKTILIRKNGVRYFIILDIIFQ